MAVDSQSVRSATKVGNGSTERPEETGSSELTPVSVLVRNSFLTLATEAGILLSLVVAMPKLVKCLGENAFGLFSLAWVVIGYMAILDLGVSRAATKYIAEHLAQSEFATAEQIVRSCIIINLVLGVAGAVGILTFSPFLAQRVFKIPPALTGEANVVFIAVAISAPVLLIQAACRGVLTSLQSFGWINSVNGIASGLQWAIAYLLASKGYGVGIVVLATVIVRMAATLVYLGILVRLLPGIISGWTWNLHHAGKLARYGGWVTVAGLVAPILFYLDRILLASFVSLAAVTVYTIPFELMGRLRVVPNSVVATLFPAFSEREVSDDKGSLQRLYQGGVRYLLLLLLPCFAYLVVLGPDVLTLWIGSNFSHQSTQVLRILAAGLLLNGLAYIPWTALQGLGRPDLTGKIQLLELPPYVLICCALIPRLGVPGAALAGSLRFGVDAVILFWAAQKYIGCHLHLRMLQRVLLPLSFLLICLTTDVYVFSGSAVRLCVGIGVLLMYALAVWKYSLDGRDRPLIGKALNLLRQPTRSLVN